MLPVAKIAFNVKDLRHLDESRQLRFSSRCYLPLGVLSFGK